MDQNGPAQPAFASFNAAFAVPAPELGRSPPPRSLTRITTIASAMLVSATLGTLASGATWPMSPEQRTILVVSACLGLLGAICGLATGMLRRPVVEAVDASGPMVERLETLASQMTGQLAASQACLQQVQGDAVAQLAAARQADERLLQAADRLEQQVAIRAAEPAEVPPAMAEALRHMVEITGRTARQVDRLERVMPELLQAVALRQDDGALTAQFDRLAAALAQAETVANASERVGAQLTLLPAIAARFEDLNAALVEHVPQLPIGALADAVLSISKQMEALNIRAEQAPPVRIKPGSNLPDRPAAARAKASLTTDGPAAPDQAVPGPASPQSRNRARVTRRGNSDATAQTEARRSLPTVILAKGAHPVNADRKTKNRNQTELAQAAAPGEGTVVHHRPDTINLAALAAVIDSARLRPEIEVQMMR